MLKISGLSIIIIAIGIVFGISLLVAYLCYGQWS